MNLNIKKFKNKLIMTTKLERNNSSSFYHNKVYLFEKRTSPLIKSTNNMTGFISVIIKNNND